MENSSDKLLMVEASRSGEHFIVRIRDTAREYQTRYISSGHFNRALKRVVLVCMYLKPS